MDAAEPAGDLEPSKAIRAHVDQVKDLVAVLRLAVDRDNRVEPVLRLAPAQLLDVEVAHAPE